MNITSEMKTGEKSTVDIIAEISAKDLAIYREPALAYLGENIEIKGFRKGQAPAETIEKHIGEMQVLNEMAHRAVADAYPTLLQKHEVKGIGQPEVSITKLAAGNPLGFTITIAVLPELKLPDYKKLAKKEMGAKSDATISDKELDEAIMQIRKMRAQDDALKAGTDPKDLKDVEPAELDDEYVKNLGDFKNVEDFKNKFRENLQLEKEGKEQEKKQLALADVLIEKTKGDIPNVLVHYELQKMMAQMEHDIAMTGMTFDDYLKHIKKTKDDLRAEWSEAAEKRAKMSLIIEKIAEEEKLQPMDDEINGEVKKIMEQYKDMKDIDENNVRAYVASMLTNQKVFAFFDEQ